MPPPEPGAQGPVPAPQAPVPAPASPAERLISGVKQQFSLAGRPATGRGIAAPQESGGGSVLSNSVAQALVPADQGYVPRYAPGLNVASMVRLTFPGRADGAFRMVEPRSQLSVSVRLIDARPVSAETAGGYLLYRGALPGGADVIHVPGMTGTEDWITVAGPSVSSLAYEVSLGDGVAGLRLYANTLELLDAGGLPRLRVSPPYLVDAKLARHEAKLALGGCSADSSAAPPWSHPVVPPSARTCRVTVTWDPGSLVYPALLDPPWTTTASLAAPGRYGHVAGRLNDNTVLVAGGFIGTPPGNQVALASAERFTLDATGNGVWAAAAPMKGGPRGYPLGIARLNRFYVIHGTADVCTAVNTSEYFSTADNDWTVIPLPATDPPRGRAYDATATLMSDSRILVAGGSLGSDCRTFTPQVWVDLLDTLTNTWSRGPDLPGPRAHHTATALGGGGAMLIGGQAAPDEQNPAGFLATTLLYNQLTNEWRAGPSLNHGRRWHGAVSLSDGAPDILVFGGRTGEGPSAAESPYGTTERWKGGAAWTEVAPGMVTPRQWNNGKGGDRLIDGTVLAVLGNARGTALTDAEVFDPMTERWSQAGTLAGGERAGSFTITVLGASRQVLVAGGQALRGAPSASVDLYTQPLPTAADGGAPGDGSAAAADATAGSADAGGPADGAPSGDAAAVTDGSAGAADGNHDASSAPGDDSGCGCHLGRGRASSSPLAIGLTLAGVAALARRRRRRSRAAG
jgi:hypothetical protein